jgi:hypothetical protein
MADFYDALAPRYHLIFADWDESIAHQGRRLGAILGSHWPGHRSVLDVCSTMQRSCVRSNRCSHA